MILDNYGVGMLTHGEKCEVLARVAETNNEEILRYLIERLITTGWTLRINEMGVFLATTSLRTALLKTIHEYPAICSHPPIRYAEQILANVGTMEEAESLFPADCGSFDVDACGADARSTPLWLQAYKFCSALLLALELDQILLLKWFVDRGAKTDFLHPDMGTTPAHLISFVLGLYICTTDLPFSHQERPIEEFFVQILEMKQNDACDCACSSHGYCIPIGCAFKMRGLFNSAYLVSKRRWELAWGELLHIRIGHDMGPWPNEDEFNNHVFPTMLGNLFSAVESIFEQNSELRLVVLRILAFDWLGIKHTCHDTCFHGTMPYKKTHSISKEEILEIQGEYKESIAKLNNLMIEFEEELSTHEGTFQDFVEGYFTYRMEEEIEAMNETTQEYLQAVEDAGVRLVPFGPSRPEDIGHTVYDLKEWLDRNNIIMLDCV